jgi:hypothetical protein
VDDPASSVLLKLAKWKMRIALKPVSRDEAGLEIRIDL